MFRRLRPSQRRNRRAGLLAMFFLAGVVALICSRFLLRVCVPTPAPRLVPHGGEEAGRL